MTRLKVLALIFTFSFSMACNSQKSSNPGPTLTSLSVTLGPSVTSVHSGMTANFFPVGGLPPYKYSVSGGGTMTSGTNAAGESYGIFVAPNAATTSTITVIDALGDTASSIANVTPTPAFTIYLSSTTSGVGYAYSFNFDPTSNTASGLTASAPTSMTVLRAMTILANGNFLLGDASLVAGQLFSPNLTLGGSLNVGTMGSPLTGIHGLCSLPNGNIIAGDENNMTSNSIGEFASDGTFLDMVYVPGSDEINTNHPGMSNCVALGNQDLLFLESDTWASTVGDVVRVQLSNGSWQAVQRFSSTDFDTSQGTSGTTVWDGVAHSDGNFYFPAPNFATTQIPKMISCPLSNINTANCSQVGTQNLPTGGGFYYGIGQIPDSNDMLLITSHMLYRYNYAAGTYTTICDVTDSTSSCYIDPGAFLRGMILQ